jgi:hypothetical protein
VKVIHPKVQLWDFGSKAKIINLLISEPVVIDILYLNLAFLKRIGKIWKKSKLNSEKIWKTQKKSKLSSDKI